MSARAVPTADGFIREPVTWYCWFLTGAYIYVMNLQGNFIPFLQEEFGLSYRVVSLHSSAFAVGIILTGFFGERVSRRLGRGKSLWLAVAGLALGAVLLCLSRAPWASITSCLLIGLFGTLVPTVTMALLSDVHGDHRAQAYAGQGIFAYAFGFAAPLLAGSFIWLGLGWRTAVLVGPTIGVLVAVYFRGLSIVEPQARADHAEQRLPPAFWAYWTLVVAVCGLEYAVLFWAPTFLERVAGLAPASAATAAAAFPLGMLLGRIALGDAVRRVAPRRLLVGALALCVVGFLLYWAGSMPAISALGIFVLGLGIAPLFPLSINFAVGSAVEAADLASVRLAISYGISMLVAPIALGALADAFGLKLAHLAVPGFVLAAYASLVVAEALEKRSSTSVQARSAEAR